MEITLKRPLGRAEPGEIAPRIARCHARVELASSPVELHDNV
jgi:hypothetical protein